MSDALTAEPSARKGDDEPSRASVPGTTWISPAAVMAVRSLRALARQPQVLAPSLMFPLFFTAVSAAAFDRTTSLAGFPDVDSFLTFLLPATILQGVMFGATSAGVEAAIDIDNGFNDRLLTAPVARIPLFLGRVAGVTVLGGVQTLVFFAVLVAFGAEFAGGLASLAVVVAVNMLFAAAVGAFSLTIAFHTGSVEAVNGFFPILFAAVFMSSAFFPPELSGGWFEAIASANPLTWMIDGTRELTIVGWDTSAAVQALVVAAALLGFFLLTALDALRRSLRS